MRHHPVSSPYALLWDASHIRFCCLTFLVVYTLLSMGVRRKNSSNSDDVIKITLGSSQHLKEKFK
jgi:hypothetical protein